MHAHKIKVIIKANQQLSFKLPDDFPAGPAEIIILASPSTKQQIVKLAGVLAPKVSPLADIDPILDSLQELRQEREKRYFVQAENK